MDNGTWNTVMPEGKSRLYGKNVLNRFLTVLLVSLFFVPLALGSDQNEIKIRFTSPPPGDPALELHKLPPEIRDTLKAVAEKYTLYLDVDKAISAGDPELYEYLFDRLSMSALLLRELKLAKYNIYEEGANNYRWIDPKGIFGHFKLVYKEPGKRIYHGSGFYDGRFMPRMEGEAIMVFKYHPVKDKKSWLMENQVYSYIKIDNTFYSTMAKILRPILPGLVRERMKNLFLASRNLSEWINRDPEEVYQRLEGSKRISRKDLIEFKHFFMDGRNRRLHNGATAGGQQ